MMDKRACENTDRELWRERQGDYYSDSIHVTKHGGIGINCGGLVYVKPLREWHKLARERTGEKVSKQADEIRGKVGCKAGIMAEGAHLEVQTPSAAEHPPKCQLCNHGPHSDSVGHSYLPGAAERDEQQEWTPERVELYFGLPKSEAIRLLTKAINAELLAAQPQKERTPIKHDIDSKAVTLAAMQDEFDREGKLSNFWSPKELKWFQASRSAPGRAEKPHTRRAFKEGYKTAEIEVRKPLVDDLIELRCGRKGELDLPKWAKEIIDAALAQQKDL